MTGFESKRQASLDTLDYLPYQGRPTRPDELAQPNPWLEAIDTALICTMLGTAESFPDADQALDALIKWHVQVALDPTVSAAAQALIDKGAAVAEPLNDWEFVAMWATAAERHDDKYDTAVEFGRAVEARHGIGIKGSAT